MEEILILKPSSLGDVVHTLPAVARIRRAWPQARLRWLVNPEWAPLLEENATVDEVLHFPRRELGGLTRAGRQWRWLKEFRSRYRSRLVLDFQGLLRTALIGRACRRPGGLLAGLSDAREGAPLFYDQKAEVGSISHAVDRYLKLAELATRTAPAPDPTAAERALQWPLPQGHPPARFDLAKGYLLLHPFSRGKGKSLTIEEVSLFCQTTTMPVVIAGRAEVATGPFDTFDHVENWLNHTTLTELIWLIRHARAVISVDSGPMHIAAALHKPLLSIHTWSDPERVGPYTPSAWILRDGLLYQGRSALRQLGFKPRTVPDYAALANEVETLF